MTDKRGAERFTRAFNSGELKLILCTTTHHYGNNLPGIAVIPCSDDDRWIVRDIIGSIIYIWQDAPFEVSTCMIKYKDWCSVWWMWNNQITISNRNKGFDCLDVNGFVRFCKKFQRMWFSHNLTQSYIHENYNATYKTLLNSMQNIVLHRLACPLNLKYYSV